LPKIQKYILSNATSESDLFHRDIRVILAILFGTVVIFDLLGLHPIIAGFFAGLVLSETLDSEILQGKLRAISYGIFIPTFIVVVGTQTDLNQILNSHSSVFLTLVIVVGSALSKFVSGTFGARIVGFNLNQSIFFGVSSIPQLSTTLAATFTANALGLIGNEIVTAMVTLSIFTTTLGPSLMKITSNHILSEKDTKKPAKKII